MTIATRVANAFKAIMGYQYPNYDPIRDFASGTTDSGKTISNTNILEYAPIWHSTNKIAGFLAQMPRLVKQDTRTVTPAESMLPELLNESPNAFMTSFDAFETAQHHAIIDGNGRMAISREPTTGEPVGLMPVHPDFVWCFVTYPAGGPTGTQQVGETTPHGPLYEGRIKWHYITSANGEIVIVPDSEMIHIKGLQHDGIVGIPMWYQARNSVGGALAAETYVNTSLDNYGLPGLILSAPEGKLRDNEKAQEYLDTVNMHLKGVRKAGKTMLLRDGITASVLTGENRANQLSEMRNFSRDEAWMWTGDMQFYSGSDAYSNAEDRDQAFRDYTMGRWVGKWEAEMRSKLLTQGQRDNGWHIDLDETAILRGSLKTRLEGYEIARRIGYLSQEEIRERDGLPEPDPGQNFDNPNTSSPEPSNGGNGDEMGGNGGSDDDSDDDGPEDSRSRVISTEVMQTNGELKRLSGWMHAERRRLIEYAKSPNTFITRADAWYGRQKCKIADIADEIGAEPWHDASWSLVLGASECPPDELLNSIDRLTKDWPTKRAAAILETRKVASSA